MSEPLDLHQVLQNGYFTTSRATGRPTNIPSPPSRSPQSSSPPKPSSRLDNYRPRKIVEARRPRFQPPSPTVEDEADALAKEYGASSVVDPAEDVYSRGDIDQQPVILEVHEHNPERRFVIVPTDEDSDSKSKSGDSDHDREKDGVSGDERPKVPPKDRKYEPVFDDNLAAPDDRPPLNRRKSRQDLPPIDTNSRPQEHYRTRSNVGTRPEAFSARQSGQFAKDEMLSPDVIKTASSRREKQYYDSGVPTSASRRIAPQRSYSNIADSRRRDKPSRRESLSPAHGGRSESNPDPRKSSRRVSTERSSESRYREDSSRSSRREPASSRRDTDISSGSTLRPRGPRPKDEEPVPTSRSSGRRRGNSTSVHQDSESVPSPEKERGSWYETRGPRPREATMPTQVPLPPPSAPPTEYTATPRSSATFPISSSETSQHLPYPDDSHVGKAARSPSNASQAPSTASMPDIPLAASSSPERSFDSQTPAATPSFAKTSAWPPPFDPERDGAAPEQEMGSYRRFSEGKGGNFIPDFPICYRKEPVAGYMDWLTLPRTDFNICPDCYQGVFGNTEFRTQFHPMLRPTDKPIACDFGSSPWYRIALLLALKNEHSDLRLFHNVDNVATTSRNQPCPGSRKALRNWYTVRDPYRKRPVPNFTVCHQCAKMVEVLLPNLTGVFIPLETRTEPVGSTCALHFKPLRKRFALYFDTLETTSEKAVRLNDTPDVSALASKIERLSATEECREDSPIPDTHWHTMQYLPEFTVCADCFDDVVRPRLGDNIVARNFYKDPQRVQLATCQLYSDRMREIFRKACRRNDPKYLKAKVLERQQVEADIHSKLVKLDRSDRRDEKWTEEQVAKLIREWKKWE